MSGFCDVRRLQNIILHNSIPKNIKEKKLTVVRIKTPKFSNELTSAPAQASFNNSVRAILLKLEIDTALQNARW